MIEKDKEELVKQFRRYLDQSPEELQGRKRLDLFSFYSELTALKNEVKIESRQVKKGLDEFRHAVTFIEKSNRAITERLEQNERHGTRELERSLLHPVFTGLLDVYDRLAAAQQSGKNSKSSFLSRFCRKETEIISAMRDGQEMTLHRLNDLLADCRIKPIKTLDRNFDPLTMRAVASDTDSRLADGVVSAELRKGFMWEGEVLRLAEVKVNRNTNQ
ncbi:MAG: nucleotide exchange factor GrpE [Desulfobulbaceae bacterium]|nr:nucleotide exchange factor GrpE [Desulfobulbaceae bacterium]